MASRPVVLILFTATQISVHSAKRNDYYESFEDSWGDEVDVYGPQFNNVSVDRHRARRGLGSIRPTLGGVCESLGVPAVQRPFKPLNVPKKLWCYWDQSTNLDSLPPYPKAVVAAWKLLNPNWSFTVVTASNLKNYVPEHEARLVLQVKKRQHRSDLARTLIMRDHGGVYLDVDCIPLLPLDEWLPKVPHGDGWFIFRLPTPRYDRTVASWFIASEPNATIPRLLAKRLFQVVTNTLKRWGSVNNFPDVLEWHYQYDKLNAESAEFRAADCRMRPYFLGTHGGTRGADCCTCCCLNNPMSLVNFKLASMRHEEVGKCHGRKHRVPVTDLDPKNTRKMIWSGEIPIAKTTSHNNYFMGTQTYRLVREYWGEKYNMTGHKFGTERCYKL